MKKRILLSVMSLVTSFALIGGATFALLSDSTVNNNNVFTTGKVDITANRDLGDPIPGPMFYTNKAEGLTPDGKVPNWETGLWYPGKSVTRTLIVTNLDDSVNAKIDGISAFLHNINDSAIAQEFANNMTVVVKPQAMPDKVLYSGKLSDLLSGRVSTLNELPISPTGIWYLDFTVTMDRNAGNTLQGIVPKVDFSIYASQN